MSWKKRYILFFILIISFNCRNDIQAEVAPFNDIEIPVMLNAYSIEEFSNIPRNTKSLNYRIKIKYPAYEVQEFYDKRFTAIGWSLMKGFNKEQWDSFIDETQKGSPKVRQKIIKWTNKELNAETVLVLIYKKFQNKPWSDELWVLCQIQPKIDIKELDKFLKKLKMDGEFDNFMNLLGKYSLKNGNIDIDKALKENKNNKHLLEYSQIIKTLRNGINKEE